MNEKEYPEPQGVKDRKLEKEQELKKYVREIDGKEYIPYHKAIHWARTCFNEGFKISRRDRTSLADTLISRIREEFNVKPKDANL